MSEFYREFTVIAFRELQFCVTSVDPDSNLLSTELEAREHCCATHISKQIGNRH